MASKEIHVVFAYGGYWAVCPDCLWDSGESRHRGDAATAGGTHKCTGATPGHYSAQRIQENQVMLSGHP